MNTRIYINTTIMGTVDIVLSDIIKKIYSSGLYEYVDNIYLIINGKIEDLNVNIGYEKISVIHTGEDISVCEFPTLKKLWDDSQNSDFNALYLHTKGVSRSHPFINDWTEMLTYFNVERWEERLLELKDFECTGVNFGGNPIDIETHPVHWGYGKAPLHYSGNFWWTRSSHIRRLPDPIEWTPTPDLLKWRMMCEMWVCSPKDARYNCAHSSGIDHYQNPYPRSLYTNQ